MSSIMPPIWAIGDVQGCLPSLRQLLEHPEITRDADARFWFCGDLINRGPDSLGTLKTIMALGDRAVCVLGNHDLHLLGVAAGVRSPGKSDTFHAILSHPEADTFLDWLRHRPLAHYEHGHLLVHAGVLPSWTLQQTLALAAEAEQALRSPDWRSRIQNMYGNKPKRWRDELSGSRRLRYIINVLTRMRMCSPDGRLQLRHKGRPVTSDTVMPWFEVPHRAAADTTIVFGHWSMLGLMLRDRLICLDTGCVWGRELTACRLHDRRLVQVACPGPAGTTS